MGVITHPIHPDLHVSSLNVVRHPAAMVGVTTHGKTDKAAMESPAHHHHGSTVDLAAARCIDDDDLSSGEPVGAIDSMGGLGVRVVDRIQDTVPVAHDTRRAWISGVLGLGV